MVDACCVYELSFPNGKQYIGVTNKLVQKRLAEHTTTKSMVGQAIRCHGSPASKVLLIGDRDYCYEMEACVIKMKGTLHPAGYNMDAGGRGVVSPSEFTRQKISQTKTGTKLTEEHKRKIGEAGKGRIATLTARFNMSKAMMGKGHTAATRKKLSLANIGNKHTAVTRRKMSLTHTGMKFTEEAKQNMSVAQKGMGLGKKASEETKRKMSEGQKRAWVRGRNSHG